MNMLKNLLLVGTTAVLTTAMTEASAAGRAPQIQFTTNKGVFIVEVYPDKAPKTAANSPVRVGLFKPGVQVTDANFIDISGIPVPGDPPVCTVDFNGVDGVTSQDIFDFLNAWFAGC